ncbi:MAG: hypothetical protein ACLTXT_08885 [Ruminococcus callidus]
MRNAFPSPWLVLSPVIAKLFAPLVWLLTKSTNGVLRLCGIDQQRRGNRNGRGPAAHGGCRSQKGTIDATENDIIKMYLPLTISR